MTTRLALDIMLALVGVLAVTTGLVIRATALRTQEIVRQMREASELLLEELANQHTLSTYAGTIEGLVDALAVGLDNGGLKHDVRRQIYAAIKEQFNLYHATALRRAEK